jgi:hypothetical protein
MTNEGKFARVETGLEGVLEELREREPIFHRAAFGRTREEMERVVAPEYWEVGASGRRYSREFIWRMLEERPPVDAVEAGWKWHGFGVRRLGGETYLLTYTLEQGERVTRRATIWERTDREQMGTGWRIVFHQGTVVTAEDETMPEGE